MTQDETRAFSSIAYSSLEGTSIPALLEKGNAVVLERLAYGAGSTNWYYCHDQFQLRTVADYLSPGSVVSFYFDGRIQCSMHLPQVSSIVQNMIAQTGEAIVGVLNGDGVHVDIEIITGNDELKAFASGVAPGSRMFYGVFPARDNDGIRAVTVTLPDKNGIVRHFPH